MDILDKLVELIEQKGGCYKFPCDGCVFHSLKSGVHCELLKEYFSNLSYKKLTAEETYQQVKIKSELRYKKAIEVYEVLYGKEELMEILL